MELKIKPKNQVNNIIENITILYYISSIMVIFFEINNFKVILETHDFYNNNNKICLFLINIILFGLFFKTGYNIINLNYNNYKNNIFYYSILSVYQFVKPIILFYIYYDLNTIQIKTLNYSITFNLFSIILNIASIKLIIEYKKTFATIESN